MKGWSLIFGLLSSAALAADAHPVVRSGTGMPVCDGAGEALQASSTGDLVCTAIGGQGGAPTDAKYIVQQVHADLSAEQALGALGTGLMLNTTTTGVVSIYAGSACNAGQYATTTSASGALTCAQVATSQLDGTITDAQLASNYSGVGTCTNQFVRATVDNAGPTCATVSLTADVTGTLPVGNGGLGMTTVTDDTVAVANGSAWQSKAIGDCDTASSALTYDTTTNAFGCNSIQGGSGVDCIYIPLYRWPAVTGATTTTTTCQATTNIGAVANRGDVVIVDMDRYTHAQLVYFGNLAAAQTGVVTVALRDIAAGSDAISTTSAGWNTSCVSRSSSVTDLTAKTGLVPFTARVGDSTAGDDPSLSTISVQFCNGSF